MQKEYSKSENSIMVAKLQKLYELVFSRRQDNADDHAVFCSLRKVQYLLEDAVLTLENLDGALKDE